MLEHVGEPTAVRLRTEGPPRSWARGCGAIDIERGAKVSGARFYFLRGVGARLQSALLNLAISKALGQRLRADDHAGAGEAGVHGGHRLSRRPRCRGVPPATPTTSTWSAPPRCRWRPTTRDEILDLSAGPHPLRGVVVVLPAGGRLLRQGHPRHHPGAPVRQGRDVLVLQARGRGGRTRQPAPLREGDAGRRRGSLPRHRCRRGGPGQFGGPQVRLRGLGTDPACLPRADLDVELHDVPGPPAGHPVPRRRRQAADRRDTQRNARHHQVAGRDPGEPPAARRQRPGTAGACGPGLGGLEVLEPV